ncbi:NAD(P)-dependent oxidoreductase [uncultured Desulfobacter sp.]|uniref:NAD(P)-dependent oxidoreductase n=1 Tax=uncultured Desulfobacter sp. TaxID=240139 RepID=UPI0029C77F5A|nr:NAD(P)-dependent oxidoreductase [uncultured Desulfobacter sp.]
MTDKNIGFIGLGVMGQSMAGHILAAGFNVRVYNRTKQKADALVDQGAVWCDSVADLAASSDVIITMVGYPADVEEVFIGPDGILENSAAGSLVIDMTTSDPALAEKLWQDGRQNDIGVLDAPVSGGDIGARNASLSIMVGGSPDDFHRALPIFKTMGTNIVHQGKAGNGQHTKMANQIAIASTMISVCESISYAKRAGLDPETVLKSIGKGAAASWSLNNLGPKMIQGDDAPGFFIRHFVKDMGIALSAAESMGMKTPGLDLACSLYKQMEDQGAGLKGTQALFHLFS